MYSTVSEAVVYMRYLRIAFCKHDYLDQSNASMHLCGCIVLCEARIPQKDNFCCVSCLLLLPSDIFFSQVTLGLTFAEVCQYWLVLVLDRVRHFRPILIHQFFLLSTDTDLILIRFKSGRGAA